MNKQIKIHYFCGILPSGTSSAMLQIVMGKIHQEIGSSVDFTIKPDLIEPVLIHRVMTMNTEPGKQPVPVITHQLIDDPFWPSYRGAEMDFNEDHFLSWRLLDLKEPSEQALISMYENFQTEKFRKKLGLVTPDGR